MLFSSYRCLSALSWVQERSELWLGYGRAEAEKTDQVRENGGELIASAGDSLSAGELVEFGELLFEESIEARLLLAEGLQFVL